MNTSYKYGALTILLAVALLVAACASTAPTETVEEPANTVEPGQSIETPLVIESPTAVAESPTAAPVSPTMDPQSATAVPESPTAAPELPTVVFRNGLVVIADGSDPIPNGAVVIEDGLITDVGPESSITVPEDAIVIDLDGRTIMPGIVDARASDLLNRLEIDEGQISTVPLELYLRNPLKTGVTTVRATGWNWDDMQNIAEIRAALNSHGNTIPSVVIVGTGLAHSESSGYTEYYSDQLVGVSTAEEARQMTEEIIQLGADQVSFAMSTGPSLNEAPEERAPVLTLDQVMAIVETAHAQDKLVGGQAIFAEEARTAVNGGIDQLLSWPTPIEVMPEELIEAIVTHSIPVVSGFSAAAPQEGDLRRFLDAGGILVYGTLAPNTGTQPVDEFRIMELAGMTPMEMIRSATANAADVLEMYDVIGTLEVGKRADVIVLEGNIFEDNFLDTITSVVYVVKNGELVIQPE